MTSSISSVTSAASSSVLSNKSASRSTTHTRLNIKPRGGPVDKRKRLAANARERKRMDLLNRAFDQLRGRLNDARNKSKYDVLVQAKEYIQALARICAEHDRNKPKPASTIAPGGNLRLTHDRHAQLRLEAKLEPAAEPEADQRLDLTIRSAAPSHWQQPIESPASSSDCCLSPISLAESLGSSGSPRCSSQPQRSSCHNLSKVSPDQFSHTGNKTAFLYQTQRPIIKVDPRSQIPFDYHQIYHPHYQSLLQAQKQTPID